MLRIQVTVLLFTRNASCISSRMGYTVDPSMAISIAPAKITANILVLKQGV